MIDPRAPRGTASPLDVRLSAEAGLAWGAIERKVEPEGSDSITAATGGATAELVLHSKGRHWRERAMLGARVGGELMLWLPR